MASIIDRSNFSYYTVPVAWLLCIGPHIWAFKYYNKVSPKEYDKVNPRTFLSELEKNPSLDRLTKEKLARAEAAHLNGYENLGLFAASVVAANAAEIGHRSINLLCFGYILNRILFNITYIQGFPGQLRGVFYYAGIGSALTLFIKAGNAARNYNI